MANSSFDSSEFHKLMVQFFKTLDHETIHQILILPVDKYYFYLKKEYPVSNRYHMDVYFDAGARIVDISLHDLMTNMKCNEYEPAHLFNNWRGKHYIYSFVNLTSPVTNNKLIDKLKKATSEFSKYVCGVGDIYYRNLNDTFTLQTVEDTIFLHGYSWPPIDYDCKYDFCCCSDETESGFFGSTTKCKKTLLNFAQYTIKLQSQIDPERYRYRMTEVF